MCMNVSYTKTIRCSMNNYENKNILHKPTQRFERLYTFIGYTCYILSKENMNLMNNDVTY